MVRIILPRICNSWAAADVQLSDPAGQRRVPNLR